MEIEDGEENIMLEMVMVILSGGEEKEEELKVI